MILTASRMRSTPSASTSPEYSGASKLILPTDAGSIRLLLPNCTERWRRYLRMRIRPFIPTAPMRWQSSTDRPADDAMYLIPFLQQKFRQIRSVLTGNTCNQCLKRACSYPSFESHLEGAEVTSGPVEVAGNVITSRGMGTAIEFGLGILGRGVPAYHSRQNQAPQTFYPSSHKSRESRSPPSLRLQTPCPSPHPLCGKCRSRSALLFIPLYLCRFFLCPLYHFSGSFAMKSL